jgi:hypothetical protein
VGKKSGREGKEEEEKKGVETGVIRVCPLNSIQL